MKLSEKLEKLRERRGVTVREVARNIRGASAATVDRWFAGLEPLPRLGEAMQLARYFDVPIGYLASDDEAEPEGLLADDEKIVVMLYRSLKREHAIDRDRALAALSFAAHRSAGPGEYRDISEYVENTHISPAPPPRKGRKPGEQAG